MSTSATHRLETQLAHAWPADQWRDTHVLLAVSGGADSVAMLRAVSAIKRRVGGTGELYAAHLNHRLRGAVADADQAWVEELCRRLAVPLEVGQADVAALAAAERLGHEAAARRARYEFLRSTAERLAARFVAVAHTTDDQVETVLHRILRGTGLAGLTGMRPARPLSPSVSLVRPLLEVRRREVLAYLAAVGQDYREDATNFDRQFTRNRLRHELLPLLREQYNADVDAALTRLAHQAGDAQQVIAQLAAEVREQHSLSATENESRPRLIDRPLRIDCRTLAGQPPIVVREACKQLWQEAGWPLQAMGSDEWQQLADLATAGGPMAPLNLPGGVRAMRNDHVLSLSRPEDARPNDS